jgi:hypothetical protein
VYFGDPGDTLLVGNWAEPPVYADDPATPIPNDYAVRLGDLGRRADRPPVGQPGPAAGTPSVVPVLTESVGWCGATTAEATGSAARAPRQAVAGATGTTEYFVKNDNQKSGVADRRFFYGDADDYVLVGNWDGVLTAPAEGQVGKGDTLTVVRGSEFFVKNSITTGMADYTLVFGDPWDYLVVGDWATVTDYGDGKASVKSGDGADQLAVVRGKPVPLVDGVRAGSGDQDQPGHAACLRLR